MVEPKRYFGLHITRTGGTSLSDLAVRILGRPKCLLLSSFTQMQDDHEQTPQERGLDPLPLFSFGHYVHESLWGLLLHRGPVYSFAVFREPRKRIQSTIRHLLSLGMSPDGVRESLAPYPNPTCIEILRCVPVARLLYRDEPPHRQALAALSAFTRVETIDELPALIGDLMAQWETPGFEIGQLNAVEARDEEARVKGFESDEFIGEDLLLWDLLQQPGWRINGSKVTSAILDLYSDSGAAAELFRMHLDRYMSRELAMLGTLAEYVTGLKVRRAELSRLIARLEFPQ